ncbi:MetQ/NlpA family ABC transporter substrate-binding protein, partial [Streptomyces sp. NRRL S-455]|uniref:MetQ/NlpA family ABC transporter substrate-binding protein n=1 Tax=Streptomyces sp. NRRL S-455 TaxID=1463908 RepID=UPI0004BFD883
HKPYLDDFTKKNGTHIVPVGDVHLEPLGLYSYSKAFESTSFSQGTAIALITVLLLSGVAVYYLRQLMKTGEVE